MIRRRFLQSLLALPGSILALAGVLAGKKSPEPEKTPQRLFSGHGTTMYSGKFVLVELPDSPSAQTCCNGRTAMKRRFRLVELKT